MALIHDLPMEITETSIPSVKIIRPQRFGDPRGFFSEVYRRDKLRDAGIDQEFTQDNLSLSTTLGTVRGLHFQIPPVAQSKLIFVIHGAILDVALDIRAGSPTFGRHISFKLDDENRQQLYVPSGFAHGFSTLKPDTLVYYKISTPYTPEHERGILWNDPDLGINWQVSPDRVVLSDRDRHHPPLKDLATYFSYDAVSGK